MKKEIWMEKLIELLNEYDKEKWLHTFWKMTQSNKIQIYGKWVCSESYLYSKSYGFIKWLVENDKIDFSKDAFVSLASELWCTAYDEKIVLMVLSISDTPIDLLCSLLK
jgi:hypothetical protein